MKVSRDTCLVLGAVIGAASVYFTPFRASVLSGDENMKKDKNGRNSPRSLHNTSDRRDKIGKNEKFYGDRTMSDILKTAKAEFLKKRSSDWKIIIPGSESFETARSNLTDSRNENMFDLNSGMRMPNDSGDNSGSTVYNGIRPMGSTEQPAKKKKKNTFSEIFKGIKRSITSRNDIICEDFPPAYESTILEPHKKKTQRMIPFGDKTVEELSQIAADLEYTEEDSKQNRFVINLKRSVSPLQKIDQNLRDKLSSKKNSKH